MSNEHDQQIEVMDFPKVLCGSGKGWLSAKIGEAVGKFGAVLENAADERGEPIWRITFKDLRAGLAASNPKAHADAIKARMRLIMANAWDAAEGADAEVMQWS